MKKSFTLAAVLLVMSTGLFAASPSKANTNDDLNNIIVVQAMRTALGFGISIQQTVTAGSVIITDQHNQIILNDKLAKGKTIENAYNLSELEEGNYFVTVNANNKSIIKQLHVYQEYGNKAYVFLQ
jgi:hypothetical protein